MSKVDEEFLKSVGADIEGAGEEMLKLMTKTAREMVLHPAYGNPSYEWSLDDFELAYRLGRGKFGRVYLAREKRSGFVVAIKTLLKKEIDEGQVELQVMREIEIQTHLKHPNILQMYCWFHDEFRIYFVLEYALHGELYKILQNSKNQRFDEKTAANYTYQVANALQYCHENDVIHRDIKPENLLLDSDGCVKLSDFGWSVHAPSNKRKTMCGTLDYLAPELVNREHYEKSIDLWCLGILCYEFLVGHPPFESSSTEETYDKIKNVKIKFPDNLVPAEARDLISKLLVKDGKNRLPLKEVMTHPWIVKNKDL